MREVNAYAAKRGPRPGEVGVSECAEMWGLGHTQAWRLIKEKGVVPYRADHYQIYVKRADAEAYVHVSRRGRRPASDGVVDGPGTANPFRTPERA